MTRRPITHDRRGVALLLVVATLALLLPAAALAATAAMQRRASDERQAGARIASEILPATDDLARAWLATSASAVVLPPDAPVPRTLVADDAFEIDGRTVTVRIAAWDQRGLVPLERTVAGSPLGRRLPAEVRSVLDAARSASGPRNSVDGLDVLAVPVGAARREVRTFPEMPHGDGDAADAGATAGTIGDLVGFAPGPHHINVSTAPRELVDAALRATGRGGLGLILGAREAGDVPTLAGPPPRGGAGGERLELVTRSDAWSFRIEIVIDGRTWAWWADYRLDDRRQWRLEQRCVIAE